MKLSDFGQRIQVVPAREQDIEIHVMDDGSHHTHVGEWRHLMAQVMECPCGFWLPVGACCPQCGRHGRHHGDA